jgi:hypothetical protein
VTFTDHFRRLETTRAPDEEFLAALGKAVRGRLHHAGLWDQPPDYLGYPEFHNWAEAFAKGDAVAPPALDCYIEGIVRRYDSLRDHLRKKGNIDGLIYLNIDRFILARQKKHDPVGYSAFKNLEAALEEMSQGGQVTAEGRDRGRLRNQTLIRFTAGAPPASREQIEAVMGAGAPWEHALPRQVKIGTGAQRLLLDCLRALPGSGVAAFRLGDLASVLKHKVRNVHAQRNRPPDRDVVAETRGDQEIKELIRIVKPEPRYENKEVLDVLLRRIREAIESSDLQERTRAGLRHLLEELASFAETGEEVPTWAELARRLGVRRTTLWDHLERLRKLVESLRGPA